MLHKNPMSVLIAIALFASLAHTFEIAYVVEPFEAIADVAIETNVLSELEVESSGNVNISLTTDALFGGQALSLELIPSGVSNSTQSLSIQSVVLGNRSHNCHGAKELSVWYRFQLDQVRRWRVVLLLEQDPRSEGVKSWEYEVPDYPLDVTTGEEKWKELRIPLRLFRPSDQSTTASEVDLTHIKGWRMELETSLSGTMFFDQLSLMGGGELLGASFYERSWKEAIENEAFHAIYHSSNISRDESKEVLRGDGSLGVDYTLEQRETWGGFLQYNHIPPARAYYNLSTAQAVSFQYDTTMPATVLGRAHLRLLLLEASDCVEGCGYPAPELENYYSFHSVLDKADKGAVALELYYDQTGEAFVWDGWFGITGNSHLDKEIIKGFKFEFSMNSQGEIGSLVNGSVTISNLMAVETFQGNTIDSQACTIEPDLRIRDFRNTFRRVEFQSQGECCQVCKRDPACYYAVTHARDCYIKDDQLSPQDVELRNDKLVLENTIVFIKETEETAGDFCKMCSCSQESRSIDCRGRDLVFSPISFNQTWVPEVLDLRDNPRLLILSSNALKDLPDFTELLLPSNLTFIPPSIRDSNKKLEKLEFETSAATALNAIRAPTEGFGDICCGRGESIALSSITGTGELTFCDLKEDEPGIDAVYEAFVEYRLADMLQYLIPSSPFMFEAAESAQKCAQYCELLSDCRYFQYDSRITVAEHSCSLLGDRGTPVTVCCDREHYNDPELKTPGWVGGYVPQTRSEVDNARVLVEPSSSKMEATESNGYQAKYYVSLGAMPLRGAVWVEPRVATASGMALSFSPSRVILYDNETVAEVTITVTNAAESKKGGTVVVTSAVEACDAAFLTSNTCSASDDLAIYLNVVTPSQKSYVATMAVLLALLMLLIVATSLWLFSEYKRRQSDSIWQIKKEELHFEDPPKVLARGRFGNVLLAEWRGTVVAVKRVIPPESATKGKGRTSSTEKVRNEAFDKSYSVMLSSRGTSSVGASCMADPSGTFGEEDLGLGSFQSRLSSVSRNSSPRRKSFLRASQILDGLRGKGNSSASLDGSVVNSRSRQKFWEKTFQVELEDYSSLQANFVQEMRHLSRLRHPSVISMMGAVIEPNAEPMLVMEYMDHGSLKDLLQNQTLFIDEEQVLPILGDITQGVRFLHATEPQVIHGDLKAKNILVDSRLRAKVADFGLSQSKNKRLEATGSPYWMAPELLRGQSSNTVQSDVFSFGVILHEVYARETPYEGENLFEVLDAIIDPRIKKRPTLPSGCPEKIGRLMKNCYEDNPSLRPTFEQLDMQLREMKLDHLNPTDLKRSESEAKNDAALLDEVFPPHVASALREGRQVEPEKKDMATILFMDIVGFTRISSGLSPLQVSNMLHRLYTKFDALSREHGVWKQETIGDSWMGVTNLTQDQPNDHVKRIVDFAEAAMKAASETFIDEENEDLGSVQLRAGFHSGPIVANVVGSRSPRWCLFGDTVNVASRMESHSQSGRIHCSDVSASLLEEQDKSRLLMPRGLQHIAGKGLMMTFFVDPDPV